MGGSIKNSSHQIPTQLLEQRYIRLHFQQKHKLLNRISTLDTKESEHGLTFEEGERRKKNKQDLQDIVFKEEICWRKN